MDLPTLRRTAAEITATAVFEMFPDIRLLGGGETPTGFFYDLIFPHSLHPETITLIEERIRQIVRERRPIRTLDMVPFSAREFLKKEGHAIRAQELEEAEGLVELIQIGSFIDLCPGPHAKNTAEIAAFKLLEIEPLEGKEIRIRGCAASSKQELKIFLKKLDSYSSIDPMRTGEILGLWTYLVDTLIWKEGGLRLKRSLIQYLKKHLCVKGSEVESPQGSCPDLFHFDLAKQIGKYPLRFFEVWSAPNLFYDPEAGLFQSQEESWVQISSFHSSDPTQEEIISSLQSIDKTLNILGFNYSLRLTGRRRAEKGVQSLEKALDRLGWKAPFEAQEEQEPQIDFQIEDGLERKWTVAILKGKSAKQAAKGSPVAFFVAASVEKITAFLIERYLACSPRIKPDGKIKKSCEELIDMMVQL